MLDFNYTLGVQFVTYLLLLGSLQLLLYRPLRNLMQQRRDTIQGSKRRAEQLETQIAEKMARYQQQLEKAKQEAAVDRARMKADGAKKEAEILATAREEVQSRMQTIRAQVAVEAAAARAQLQQETRDHALGIAASILGRDVK